MESDSFISPPRWEVLKILVERPSSPSEIAIKMNTTASFVSQQLKVLSAAGLIKKVKTGRAEKGKPRSIFSLAEDFFYIAGLASGFANKKVIKGSGYRGIILKILMWEDESVHYQLLNLILLLHNRLENIKGIFICKGDSKSKILFVLESKETESAVRALMNPFKGKADVQFINPEKLTSFLPQGIMALHDPGDILNKLKGGIVK